MFESPIAPGVIAVASDNTGGWPDLPGDPLSADVPSDAAPATAKIPVYDPSGKAGTLTSVSDGHSLAEITFPDGSSAWFPDHLVTDAECGQPLSEPPAA